MPFRKRTCWPFLLCMACIATAAILMRTGVHTYPITQNFDDGTEVSQSTWYENGVESSSNYMGWEYINRYDTGFRFFPEDLNQGERIIYARLRLAADGGEITSSAPLVVEGVLQDSPTGFSQNQRPSQKTPKTRNTVSWEIDEEWRAGMLAVPLWYSSPDLSNIINEILALPGWGSGPEGKSLILTIKAAEGGGDGINFVKFYDFNKGYSDIKSPAALEVYKSVYDTFLGKEILGRISDTSVTVNLYSLINVDVYVEYGTAPGIYTHQTPKLFDQPAEEPIEIVLDYLLPNTRFYYRILYREANVGPFTPGPERTFHTQRPMGSSFAFAVQADEHIQAMHMLPPSEEDMQLYNLTLGNMEACSPDFILSLGDFAHTEFTSGRSAKTLQEAKERYLLQRSYLDAINHSIPFYLVIGNHEGEQGWYYFDKPNKEKYDNLAIRSTIARKAIMPNPVPDGFYTGNDIPVPDLGYREDYYAWEWGDALFVVIAPFWYTKKKPSKYEDGWLWTLGKEQYDWLYDTLHQSTAKWKFVFTHHLVSTMVQKTWPYKQPFYGRGGIEVAKFAVNGWPTFEWGGEDENGNLVFDQMRAGWSHGPIHDFLVQEGVDIVFHGHDHFFAKQDLDGIVYLSCPQPGCSNYNYGYMQDGGYTYGDFLPNSGHIQVFVGPSDVTVEYVRAYLPGDGTNGEIAYSLIIN